jgi:alpha-1,3-glucosyltransferase
MQSALLFSVYLMNNKQYLLSAFIYALLINFKHIYMYASLAFFAYLIKNYVLKPTELKLKVQNLIKVSIVTLIPFLISFGPFLLKGGIK